MTKRSAIVIAAGLVASLMAGMVGVVREAQRAPVIVRTVAVAPTATAPAVQGEPRSD